MRVGPPLVLAALLIAGLSLPPPAFPCEPLESSEWYGWFGSGLTLAEIVAFAPQGRLQPHRIFRQRTETEPIRFRATEAPFPLEASLSMLTPEEPLPDGEYYYDDGTVAVVIDASAPARPTSVGTVQTLHVSRRLAEGCDCSSDVCGSPGDEATVVVELSGLQEEDSSYGGNYAIVVREEETGLEEAFLMRPANGMPFDGTWSCISSGIERRSWIY